jgi:hypothetical protein
MQDANIQFVVIICTGKIVRYRTGTFVNDTGCGMVTVSNMISVRKIVKTLFVMLSAVWWISIPPAGLKPCILEHCIWDAEINSA